MPLKRWRKPTFQKCCAVCALRIAVVVAVAYVGPGFGRGYYISHKTNEARRQPSLLILTFYKIPYRFKENFANECAWNTFDFNY